MPGEEAAARLLAEAARALVEKLRRGERLSVEELMLLYLDLTFSEVRESRREVEEVRAVVERLSSTIESLLRELEAVRRSVERLEGRVDRLYEVLAER